MRDRSLRDYPMITVSSFFYELCGVSQRPLRSRALPAELPEDRPKAAKRSNGNSVGLELPLAMTEPIADSSNLKECWSVLDGQRVRYLCGGSGPPLLLLHGLLGYSFSWRFTLPALSKHATVYAVDMPGAGFSDRPPNPTCSFRAHAERLLRFLDSADVESCDLLGTSHGGAIVMMAAALAPERIRRLILVAPVNPWSAHGRRLAPFLSSAPVSRTLLRLEPCLGIIHDTLLRRLYGDPRRIPAGTLAGYSAAFKIPGTLKYGLGVVSSWNRDLADLEAVLPRIADIPAFILWGSQDTAVSPDSAQMLRRVFKCCQVEIFDGVGHLPYEEVPERFNASLLRFLSQKTP
jgi:pimeloyl-ACP methyl ester carboxylesterase